MVLALAASIAFTLTASAAPGWGDPRDRCGGPVASRGEALRRDAACQIRAAGPRDATNRAGRARLFAAIDAALPDPWIRDRVGGDFPAAVACRPGQTDRVLLLLAHVDAVHADVPGAADNAASVAILVDAARRLARPTPRTVCVAFPDGEEVGLRGSVALARALARGEALAGGTLRRDALDLVVSLDLIGAGRPTWNGLGPPWDAAALRALLAAAPADVPWVYRARSHALPALERSDHAPFTFLGVRSAHLMTRGRAGVTWSYHTPDDDAEALDPATIEAVAAHVDGLIDAPPHGPPTTTGEPALVLPWIGSVLPGWAALAWAVAALVAAAASLVDPALRRGTLRRWGASVAALVALPAAGALAAALVAAGRPLGGTLAGPAVAAAWLGATLPLLLGEARLRAAATTVGTAALGIGLLVFGHPLLTIPVATAAAAVGWWGRLPARGWVLAPLAAWPALYLLRPDGLRELAFHGLAPDDARTVAALLVGLGPAALAALPAERLPAGRVRRWVVGAVVVAAAAAIATGWALGPWDPPFPPRDVRWPGAP